MFTIHLPPAQGERPQHMTSEQVSVAVRDTMHVLVVEDNDDARVMLRDVLESRGQRVDVAADGLAGVELACSLAPDVMLIDIGLPKLDGYQVAGEIRRRLDKPPYLIAMTGYGHERDHALAAGFDIFMVKPIDVFELETALAEIKAQGARVNPGPASS